MAIIWNTRSPQVMVSPSSRMAAGVTPGVGGGLPKSAGLKGAGAASQPSSPRPTHTGIPWESHTWFSTTWSQCPCVSSTATGSTASAAMVSATQRLLPAAGSTMRALPPSRSATT